MIAGAHPILSCGEAREWEARLFGGDEAREWRAMQRAGAVVAEAVLEDFAEIGGFRPDGRILVLVGKGHNGGDALLATTHILTRFRASRAEVVFAFGERALRPLAARAWRELMHAAAARVTVAPRREIASAYELCLDGVFGFQFRPPVPPEIAALLAAVAKRDIRLRAAVDLPSGLHEDSASSDAVFRADFTYATGIVKTPLLRAESARRVGRVRYLDLGFFPADESRAHEKEMPRPFGGYHVVTRELLAPLRGLRDPVTDKRHYGHVFVLGGSRSFPGAILMTVLGALRTGAGLVTAFVPEPLAPAFAARVPEAMWVGWPETESGALAVEGQGLLAAGLERADALVIGPGLSSDRETLALVADIVRTSQVPLVLDADALQADIVGAGDAPRVLTPHRGELARLKWDASATWTGARAVTTLVAKGRLTEIIPPNEQIRYVCPFGGPVLARGGSGDILAGMIGTLLAQSPSDPSLAAARGVVWHGRAADLLARAKGQVAVHTTELLEFLGAALR